MKDVAQRLLDDNDARGHLGKIPNVVYALATAVKEESGRTILFFDVSLADQYGKFSAASKNVTTSIEAREPDSPQNIRSCIAIAVMELESFIQSGDGKAKYAHLADVDSPVPMIESV